MANDAVTVLQAVGVEGPVHVAGFSGGAQIAQQLVLRHPELVRSTVLVSTWARQDGYFRAMIDTFRWLVDAAPNERAALEAFFLWIYTPRATTTAPWQRSLTRRWRRPAPSRQKRSPANSTRSRRITCSTSCT
jgi:pimeloyl-ACP methyl ester carboxylesterase